MIEYDPTYTHLVDTDEAQRFLDALGCNGNTRYRTFDDSKTGAVKPTCYGPDQFDKLAEQNQNGAGVFLVVNETTGDKDADVTNVRAVFVDLDGAPIAPVTSCGLPPHIVVESSPGRYHAYWLVVGCPLDQFKPMQQAIAGRFNGDRSVCNLSRVMRLPGFLHRKGEPFRTRIISVAGHAPYSVQQVIDGLQLAGFMRHEEHKTVIREQPTGNRPGDDFNRRATWGEVLTPAGWTLSHTTPDGRGLWNKPGHTGQQSATTNYAGSDLLYCFSDSAELPVNEGVNKFAVYTLLNHGGDYAAAAADLVAQGYGDPIPTQGPDAETPVDKAPEATIFPVVPFPDVLPAPFDRLTTEYAKGLQTSLEYISMLQMTIVSGAVGNSIRISPKLSWLTAPFLWYLYVDDTGEGKSHPANSLMKPVYTLQGTAKAQHDQAINQYNLEELAYKADKKNNNPPAEPAPMRHYYTGNFTIESMIPMYEQTSRGLIAHVDEAAGLFKGLNQYKSGKGGNDTENLLSLFDAGPLKSDRASGCKYARESGVAFFGGIQRAVFDDLFNDLDYANGLVYRFLPMIGNAPPSFFTLDVVSQEAQQTWDIIVNWMYSIPADVDAVTGHLKPFILTLNPQALETWTVFQHRYTKAKPFCSPRFRGYIPKLITYCLKFAATLHIMSCYQHDALAQVVSGETMNHAVMLTDFFAGQAREMGNHVKYREPLIEPLGRVLTEIFDSDGTGSVLLSGVRDRLNAAIPPEMQVTESQHKRLATLVRSLSYRVDTGAANKTFVYKNC